uniref:microsomal epoxide hydrolase n=1 Tax=Trichogramma kaykai TaxID=54128 RepID=A0ABD2WKD5_9HYME
MAVIFKNLMTRLGYQKFYTQGGDWGSLITKCLAILFPEHVIGAHFNMCVVESAKAHLMSLLGSFIPSLVIDSEHHSKMYPLTHHLSRLIEEMGYMHIQATKPDTVGTALSDSPAGLAAYILEKFSTWTDPEYRFRDDGGLLEKFTLDELLDNLMVYWVTNSIVTSQRLYAENFAKPNRDLAVDKYVYTSKQLSFIELQKNIFSSFRFPVKVPSACAMFPHELMYRPESIMRDQYVNLIQFTHPARGGHFAAFEEPELFADDVWSFVRKNEQLLVNEKLQKAQKKTTTNA